MKNIFAASGNEFLGLVQFARFSKDKKSAIRKKPSLNAEWLWSLVIRVGNWVNLVPFKLTWKMIHSVS